MKNRVAKSILASVASVVLIAGCSEDKPSKAEIVKKISAEAEFATAKEGVGAEKFDVFVSCVADFVVKEGKASDLKEYVDGKRTIENIRVPEKVDDKKAFDDCLTKAGLGDLPTGIPTGIPTDIPTDLPTGIPTDISTS